MIWLLNTEWAVCANLFLCIHFRCIEQMLPTYLEHFKMMFPPYFHFPVNYSSVNASLVVHFWAKVLSISPAGICPVSLNYQKSSLVYISSCHFVPASVRFESEAEMAVWSGCLWRTSLYCCKGCKACYIHPLKAAHRMSHSLCWKHRTKAVCVHLCLFVCASLNLCMRTRTKQSSAIMLLFLSMKY